jgi:hypothetical protein
LVISPYETEYIYLDYLNKHNNVKSKIKVALVLKQVPRHEDIWGDGSIAPQILNCLVDLKISVSMARRSKYRKI